MDDPPMFIPRRWRDTDFGRRFYTEGWQDGTQGRPHRYQAIEAGLELVQREGRAALLAYEDGYRAGMGTVQ